jgi:hypothetical protein
MIKELRMTRPTAEGRTSRLGIKLTPSELKSLDDYCDAQQFPPSRGEAARRAIRLLVADKDKGQRRQT